MDGNNSDVRKICLRMHKDDSQRISLNSAETVTSQSLISIPRKLFLCFPELDIRSIPKASFCKNCLTTVDNLQTFINLCFEREEKNNKHFATIPTEGKSITSNYNGNGHFENCRMCLKFFDDSPALCFDFKNYNQKLSSLHKIFYFCYPELDIRICQKTLICESCFKAISVLYRKRIERHYTIEIFNYSVDLTSSTQRVNSVNVDEIETEVIRANNTQEQMVVEQAVINMERNVHHNRDSQPLKITLKLQKQGVFDAIVQKLYQLHQKYNLKSNLQFDIHNLLIHDYYQSTQANEKRFNCINCKFSTCYRSEMQSHMLLHSNGTRRHRNTSRCITESMLQRRISTKNIEKRFKCNSCGFKTSHRSTLQHHMYCHNAKSIHNCGCTKCAAKFKSTRQRHVTQKIRTNRFNCDRCEYTTNHRSSLRNHYHHKHVCSHSECNAIHKSTQRKSKITDRLIKRFKCNNCEYRTKRKTSLQNHLCILEEKPECSSSAATEYKSAP